MIYHMLAMSIPPPNPREFAASRGSINTYAHERVNPRTTRILQNNDEPHPASSALLIYI
jgi:hypothetical protein